MTVRIQSKLSRKVYLRALKGSLDEMFAFGEARLIGTIIGPFFSVTYCSGYEFNHKITNEKSRAIGFVREMDGQAEVRCVRLKGLTNPVSLCILYAMCIVMFAVADVFANSGFSVMAEPAVWWGSLVATFMIALITAVQDSLTEQGQKGSETLTRILLHPEDFCKW